MLPNIGNHIEDYTRKPRKRKCTRKVRREALAGKTRRHHGGRGRKYGLKGGKKAKGFNIQSLIERLKPK